jgi:hypothetical protein
MIIAYYDENWKPVDTEEAATYSVEVDGEVVSIYRLEHMP